MVLQRGVGTAGLAAGLMILSDQVIGNVVDPLLQGRTQRLSPLVVLASIVFWGWVWGPMGALLAAPMLIAITVICQRVPALRPVAVLLAGRASDASGEEQTGSA